MSEITVEYEAPKTDNVEECKNQGCGFNVDGACTASGTECFGFIGDDDE